MKEAEVMGNSTATAYKILRERILNKELWPGTKIKQGEIAKELGISRTPLVKALHKLESDGLVDNSPQKGFYVHRLSIQELTDAYTLLEALNSVLIPDIFDELTDKHIQKMNSILAPFKETQEWTDDIKQKYSRADREFHDFLWSLCKNRLAFNIHQTFQVFNRAMGSGLIRDPSDSLKEHLGIVEALDQRDMNRGAQIMINHFRVTKNTLRGLVDKLKQLGIDPQTVSLDQIPGGLEKQV